MKKAFCIVVLLLFIWNHGYAQHPCTWGNWVSWGEQSDGTYRNPVLPGDFSDLDCIRVGEDYYAITSTFQYSPGMTILHSKDLVNWTIIGHAVEDIRQIGPALNWDRMDRYGRGIWAGSIRYNDGTFYVLFGTPEEGFFTTWAKDPRGPWAPLTNILPEAGWDDCSAIWDENGQAYFVGTCFREGYKTYLFKMTPDCSSIERSSAVLLHQGDGCEASKLIKVGKYYYLIYSTVEHGIRFVVGKRTLDLSKPDAWSEEKRLMTYNRESHEPNQGGIILGPDNNQWYFFTHHGHGDWSGRIASLLPVTWKDGWPIMGRVGEDGLGYMVWSGKMPLNTGYKRKTVFFDDFKSKKLDPNWAWNYYPRNDMWSLTDKKGHLRMKAVTQIESNNLKKTPNILTQRIYRTSFNQVTIKIKVKGMADGQVAGLCHYALTHAYIGLQKSNENLEVVFNENEQIITLPIKKIKNIWFRSIWGLQGISTFSYSTNGKTFVEFGNPYQFTWGDYRGTRVGVFTFNGKEEKGYIDIDFFKYERK